MQRMLLSALKKKIMYTHIQALSHKISERIYSGEEHYFLKGDELGQLGKMLAQKGNLSLSISFCIF